MRFEGTSEICFSWAEVAQALWQRYPNPFSTHVLTEDTFSRHIKDDKLFSKRILTKTNRLPKWGERLVKANKVCIVEESIVDPKNREIQTYTRNIGMSRIMSVVEKVTYRPSSVHPKMTEVQRVAWIESGIFGLSYAIQKFGYERYKSNLRKTNNGLFYVLHSIFPHKNIGELPPEHQNLFMEQKEKLKEAAKETAKRIKNMKNMAKENTQPVY